MENFVTGEIKEKWEVSSQYMDVKIYLEETDNFSRVWVILYNLVRDVDLRLDNNDFGVVRIKPDRGITINKREVAIGWNEQYPQAVAVPVEFLDMKPRHIYMGLAQLRAMLDTAMHLTGRAYGV